MQKHPWYLIIMVFAFIVTGLMGTAHAKSSYLTAFKTAYPSAATTLGGSCVVCHPAGGYTLNPYATAYKNAGHLFPPIEPLDSDADGFTNIAEINAGTNPGDPASKPATTPPVTVTLASLAISGPATVNESGTATYAATATMSDGSSKAVTATWSENSTATTISAAGVLTASAVTANQAVVVSASYTEGSVTKSATYNITVVDVPVAVTLASLAISGPATVNESGTATYAATATMSDGSSKAVTAIWSENSTATTISAAGVLTASAVTANQAVVVSASYTEGAVAKSATYNVTVVDVPVTPPPVTVTLASLAISGPATVNESGTATYAATATMSNGTTKAVTATWSENSTATTISAAGVLTASAVTANQAVVVSASYTEGGVTKSATYNITVVDVPVVTPPVTPPGTADSDGDGMPNDFELAYGLDPNDALDASLNPDGDVLNNLNEYLGGTDPKNPDTDNDGVWDGGDLVPTDKNRPLIDAKGQHRYGAWFMDDGNKQWNGDKDVVSTNFGGPMDLPVVGDWNGAGIDKVGVYRGGKWYLDSNANDSWDPGVDIVAVFGAPSDLPVAGDWNGDGKAKIGVYRGGTWYLDNGNGQWDSGVDTVGVFGAPTDLPVAGDINGDGKAEIGVYRPSTGEWFFDRDNNGSWSGCSVDLCAGPFGAPSDIPAMGDWNGDGKYEAGVYRQGTWYLDNGNFKWDPNLDQTHTAFGASYDLPVIGDWNADGKSDIGTFR